MLEVTKLPWLENIWILSSVALPNLPAQVLSVAEVTEWLLTT